MSEFTYAESGVDIDAGNEAVRRIRTHVRSTHGPRVLTDIGLFGGLYELDENHVLVASADGVGTKLMVGLLADRLRGLGMDLVNHCVNDILTTGARPLFFLDYFSTGKLIPEQLEEVVAGLADACRTNGCALIGGETAEMPGLYSEGDFDLAGFIVGQVERRTMLQPERIVAGDILIGLPANGLHTNGYSLARAVFALNSGSREERQERLLRPREELGESLADALLRSHPSYLADLQNVLTRIKGLAHITGGGLLENVPRILPEKVAAVFDVHSWSLPPIFDLIRRDGKVPTADMYRTFNMGLGMVAVVDEEATSEVLRQAPGSRVVGEVTKRVSEAVVLQGLGD